MKKFVILLVVLGAAAPLVLARCPDSFVGLSGSCYHFVTSGRWSWKDARKECQGLGADLAVFDRPEKLVHVSDFMNEHLGEEGTTVFWVGGQKTNGIWTWVNGDRINVRSNVWVPDAPETTAPDPRYTLLTSYRPHGRRYIADENSRVPAFICEI